MINITLVNLEQDAEVVNVCVKVSRGSVFVLWNEAFLTDGLMDECVRQRTSGVGSRHRRDQREKRRSPEPPFDPCPRACSPAPYRTA